MTRLCFAALLLLLLLLLLAGCSGVEFSTADATEADAGTGGVAATGGAPGTGGVVATGGAPEVDAGDGAPEASSGGLSQGTGDASEAGVSLPRCCIDSDCPSDVPFCSPWGTCYQGGDPYNCDYDSFCESFCVHCSGSVAGACEEKRCVCS